MKSRNLSTFHSALKMYQALSLQVLDRLASHEPVQLVVGDKTYKNGEAHRRYAEHMPMNNDNLEKFV